MHCFINSKPKQDLLPISIKEQLISNFLFKDIFQTFPRFFDLNMLNERQLLSDISFGFMPRIFMTDDEDRIIYEEN